MTTYAPTPSQDQGHDFVFATYTKTRQEQRRLRRLELRDALAQGLAIWHGGSIWSTAGVTSPNGRFGQPAHGFAVFVEPYESDPVYLAEHIENREYGFGFKTEIIRTTGVD